MGITIWSKANPTKETELIAFNNADEVGAVKIKIKLCPICGRKLEE